MELINNDIEVSRADGYRPALFADQLHLLTYGRYFRSALVGMLEEVRAAALIGPGPELTEVLSPTVELIDYPILKFPLAKGYNRRYLLERLDRFKPTILHGIWPAHTDLLARLAEQLQIPFVLTFFQLPGRLSHFDLSLSRAQLLIAVSEPIEKSLRTHLPQMNERIVRVPLGCYTEKICACFSQPERIPSIILIEPLKSLQDFEPLLQAVRHLRLDGFEFLVGVLGTGKAESAIRRRLHALGLSGIVMIVPPLRPMRSILSGADIFIHLKDQHTYNPYILYAMSAGLAVCGSRDSIGGHLSEDQNAEIFDAADELSIYTSLKKLLSRREWTRQIACSGQEHVRSQHQVSRMVAGMLESYQRAQQDYRQLAEKAEAV